MPFTIHVAFENRSSTLWCNMRRAIPKVSITLGLPLLLLWFLLLSTTPSVTTAQVTSLEDIAGETGQVAGTLTADGNQTPAGLTVILAVTPTVNFGTTYYTVTNALGQYQFPTVLPLSYTLQVYDPQQIYANMYYDGAAHPNQARVIAVEADISRSIDIQLMRGAQISGMVTVNHIAPYRLYLLPYRWTGKRWQPLPFYRQEQVGNHYRLAGLLPGRYRLAVTAILADGDTRHEGFHGGTTLDTATDIELFTGTMQASLDIDLPPTIEHQLYLPLIHRP